MANLSGFDANKVEPSKEFEPIPAADYKLAITESETKPTKAGTGSYLSLKIQVVDGEHKGRLLFENLNLDNPNQQAVEIAKGSLSAICRAVGVMTPNDSAELHNKPFIGSVKLEKRKDTGEMQNRIKSYKSLSEATQPVAAATDGSKPW